MLKTSLHVDLSIFRREAIQPFYGKRKDTIKLTREERKLAQSSSYQFSLVIYKKRGCKKTPPQKILQPPSKGLDCGIFCNIILVEMKNQSQNNYTLYQLKLPVDLERIIEISDPIIWFYRKS